MALVLAESRAKRAQYAQRTYTAFDHGLKSEAELADGKLLFVLKWAGTGPWKFRIVAPLVVTYWDSFGRDISTEEFRVLLPTEFVMKEVTELANEFVLTIPKSATVADVHFGGTALRVQIDLKEE